MSKTPLMFVDELLNAWGSYYIDRDLYKQDGISYAEAMASVYGWQNYPKEKLLMADAINKALSIGVEQLREQNEKELQK